MWQYQISIARQCVDLGIEVCRIPSYVSKKKRIDANDFDFVNVHQNEREIERVERIRFVNQ